MMPKTSREIPPEVQNVLHVYHSRQTRASHPVGKTDRGGRWYPADEEYQPCCAKIRYPSRAYRWSYMVHCRTLDHVAHLLEVDPHAARSALRRLQNAQRPAATAPSGLCLECGASWTCDHVPAESETAGMTSVSVRETREMVELHLAHVGGQS